MATDHCPFCRTDKLAGLDDFTGIPNGLGSVEHRLDLLHQGVVDGRLSLERWVDVCSTTPAKMFGLHPRKGVVAEGSDADLVVYDRGGAHAVGGHATTCRPTCPPTRASPSPVGPRRAVPR